MNERKRKAPNEIMRSPRMCAVGGDCKACAYYDNEDGFDCSDTLRHDAIDCIRDLVHMCTQYGMRIGEYQERMKRLCAPGTFDARLRNASLSLSIVAGVCRDLLTDYLYQGQELDHVALAEAMGAACGYLADMANSLGLSLEGVMRRNLKMREKLSETMDGMAEIARSIAAKLGETAKTMEKIHDAGVTEDMIAKKPATGIPHGGLCYLYGRMNAPDGNWCKGCRWANDPGVDCHGGHRFEVKGEDK